MSGEILFYAVLGLGGLVILITPAIFAARSRQRAKREVGEFISLADTDVFRMQNGSLKFNPHRAFNYMIAVPLVIFLVAIVAIGVNEIIPSLREERFSAPSAALIAFGGLILVSIGFASILPLLRLRTCTMNPSKQTVRVGWKRYKYDDIQRIVIEGSPDYAKKRKGSQAVYIRLKLSRGDTVALGGSNGFVSQTMKKQVNKVLILITEALGDYAGRVTVDNKMW
jgi:hypothetical protein